MKATPFLQYRLLDLIALSLLAGAQGLLFALLGEAMRNGDPFADRRTVLGILGIVLAVLAGYVAFRLATAFQTDSPLRRFWLLLGVDLALLCMLSCFLFPVGLLALALASVKACRALAERERAARCGDAEKGT